MGNTKERLWCIQSKELNLYGITWAKLGPQIQKGESSGERNQRNYFFLTFLKSEILKEKETKTSAEM